MEPCQSLSSQPDGGRTGRSACSQGTTTDTNVGLSEFEFRRSTSTNLLPLLRGGGWCVHYLLLSPSSQHPRCFHRGVQKIGAVCDVFRAARRSYLSANQSEFWTARVRLHEKGKGEQATRHTRSTGSKGRQQTSPCENTTFLHTIEVRVRRCCQANAAQTMLPAPYSPCIALNSWE